jgi:glycine cleavage system H protein
MVITLVLTTFILLVAHDYYLQRRHARLLEAKAVPPVVQKDETSFSSMNAVSGFKLPAHFAYHASHSWAMKDSLQVVRVGMDDFAAHLVGKIDGLELPARGRWLRQGERGWAVTRGTHRFEMLSPIEGEVIDINPEVLRNPSLAREDPFGKGWLLAVQAPAVEGNMKNLLHGRLAQRWMEESVSALHTRVSPGSGTYLQDGGHPVDDMLGLIPESDWDNLVREMLG